MICLLCGCQDETVNGLITFRKNRFKDKEEFSAHLCNLCFSMLHQNIQICDKEEKDENRRNLNNTITKGDLKIKSGEKYTKYMDNFFKTSLNKIFQNDMIMEDIYLPKKNK